LSSPVFISDFIGDYDSETMRLYIQQFPVRTKDIIDVFQDGDTSWFTFQSREMIYLMVFNLTKNPKTLPLPDGQWINKNGIFQKNDQLNAFETRVYLKDARAIPQFLFSDGHIFPGMEIEKIEFLKGQIFFDLHPNVPVKKMEFIFEVSPDFMEYETNGVNLATEVWNGKRVVRTIIGQ